MAENTVYVHMRTKDIEILCKCGGKTYPVAHLLAHSVIEVSVFCRKCGAMVKQYNRMIQQRRPHD